MEIAKIKKQMIKWTDFYGGELLDHEAVKKAATKDELSKILNDHSHFLELQAIDAETDLCNFRNKLGLE